MIFADGSGDAGSGEPVLLGAQLCPGHGARALVEAKLQAAQKVGLAGRADIRAIALAVWTKYQAVCIAVAIALFAVVRYATRGYAAVRAMLLPIAAVAVGGATALGTLVWYFWTYGGPDIFSRTGR